MHQLHVIDKLVTIILVILGFYTALFDCNSNEMLFDQSDSDALCCCQANDVPRWCEGSCRSGRAKQYIYNLTETPKNDYTIWMSKLFFGSACKSYGNIMAGCWKQFHPDQCCVELTILNEKEIDEIKKSEFTGTYQFDIDKLTDDEIRNGTLSYTHYNGKHSLYKTNDGVWAIDVNQGNNVTYISSCDATCPEDCSIDLYSIKGLIKNEFRKGDNPEEKMDIIIGCSTYPNTSDSVRACLRNFNYTNHPNAKLLPKDCGEQKTGWENSMTKVTVRSLGSNEKLLQKRPRKQGGSRARIVGGNDAKPMDYPWMAALHWPNTEWKEIWMCGGSIINDRYILTAAHCLKKKPHEIDTTTQVDFVRLGEQTFNQTKDCMVGKEDSKTLCADPPQDIDVEKIFIHPRYKQKDAHLVNDIALIRLSKKIHFTDSVRPLCLPLDGDKEAILKGKPLKLAGWGYTTASKDNSAKPKILQEINLRQRDNTYCEEFHSNLTEDLFDFYGEGLICAGGDPDGGKDGCQGDSGSPLMVKNEAKNQVVQVGLMSGSPVQMDCGAPYPSYYTRVSYYLKWIMDNIYE